MIIENQKIADVLSIKPWYLHCTCWRGPVVLMSSVRLAGGGGESAEPGGAPQSDPSLPARHSGGAA